MCAVDASAPNSRARMSFSRPITSKPSSTKRATDSEPISPPEPVTIAVLIRAVPADRARSPSSGVELERQLVGQLTQQRRGGVARRDDQLVGRQWPVDRHVRVVPRNPALEQRIVVG